MSLKTAASIIAALFISSGAHALNLSNRNFDSRLLHKQPATHCTDAVKIKELLSYIKLEQILPPGEYTEVCMTEGDFREIMRRFDETILTDLKAAVIEMRGLNDQERTEYLCLIRDTAIKRNLDSSSIGMTEEEWKAGDVCIIVSQ